MIWLLSAPLLTGGGVFLAYKRSPAARARKRVDAAARSLEEMQAEARDIRQRTQSDLQAAGRSYKEQIQRSRLSAISIDALKLYGSGMRLQAVRDAGHWNLAAIEGMDERSLSRLRGVGPKSAGMMARAAATAIAKSRAEPIPWPSAPFVEAQEQALVRAVYRVLWLERSLTETIRKLDEVVAHAAEVSSTVASGTSLLRWMWRMGASEGCRKSISAAEQWMADLEEPGETTNVRDALAKLLAEARSVTSSQVDREILCRDFAAHTEEYDRQFERVLGKGTGPRHVAPAKQEAPRHDEASTSPRAGLLPVEAAELEPLEFESVEMTPPPPVLREMVVEADTEGLPALEETVPETGIEVANPASDGQKKLLEQLGQGPGSADLAMLSREEAQRKISELVLQRAKAKAGSAAEDGLHSVRVQGEGTEAFFQIPARPSAAIPSGASVPTSQSGGPKQATRWVPPGESVTVQGIEVRHGFFYLAWRGRGSNPHDPSVIDPSLAARAGAVAAFSAAGESYAALSPELRWQYLTWLSQGAVTKADPVFGKLYFYALERRFVELVAEDRGRGERLQQMRAEVARVAKVLQDATWDSAWARCRRLLDYADQLELATQPMEEPPAVFGKEYSLPFGVRYGLGTLLRDGRPISAEWALCWAKTIPNLYFRTPATRCPDEFAKALRIVLAKRFPQGWKLPANKTPLRIEYTDRSWTLPEAGTSVTLAGVPDVCALTAPQEVLREMVEESTALLEPYSRFVGRHEGKAGSLEACLLLPAELWPADAEGKFRALEEQYADRMLPVRYGDLLAKLGSDDGEAATRILEIARALEQRGLGMEPDVLAGSRKPKQEDMVVLFRLEGKVDPERRSQEYQTASLLTTLAACLANADGHASEDELAAVDRMAERWEGLSGNHRARLRAQYRLQVGQTILLSSLRGKLTALPADAKEALARSLAPLASADGNVSPAEVKVLEQLYRMLGLEAKALYRHLYEGSAGVPATKAAGPQKKPFVDANRLAELRRETAQVDELLAAVFAEEETAPVAAAEKQRIPADAATSHSLRRLDAAHEAFLAWLLMKPEWSRAELLAEAGKRKLMLDGALERINDAAFDELGEALLEGDDPVMILQDLLKES